MSFAIPSTELFAAPAQQQEIRDGYFETINPVNSLDGTRVVEFVIKGSEDYISLKDCILLLVVRVKNADNANLAAAAEIATINYPLASMFEHLEVYLNNDLVTNTSEYGYRSYMETAFSYSNHAKNTWLQLAGYHEDTSGAMNTLGAANTGFEARKTMFTESALVELVGKIHSGLFNQEKLLLNNVDLRLVFTRNKDDFCVMSATPCKLELVEAQMVVRRVKLEDSKSNEIQSILSKNDILYHVPRVDMRTYTFPAGLRNISVRNPATGNALPSRIMLTIVSNNAYNGSVTENPFNFQHFNMTSADITVNAQSVYGKPLTINVPNKRCALLQWHHYAAMGFTSRDDGNGIGREDFNGGYFNIPADLQPSLPSDEYQDPLQSGNLEIDLAFSVALPNTVTVVVYLEYNSIIRMTSSRRAVTDYA